MNTRREFIKNTCISCIGTVAIGLSGAQLSSCASLPIYKTKIDTSTVLVPVTSFGESNVVIVRDMDLAFDILLVKRGDADFYALYMKCSHRDNPVTATKNGLYCSTHGSTFDLDGNVTKEPATAPLEKFKATLAENNVLINLKS
jgi:Rieske Fe-S protein